MRSRKLPLVKTSRCPSCGAPVYRAIRAKEPGVEVLVNVDPDFNGNVRFFSHLGGPLVADVVESPVLAHKLSPDLPLFTVHECDVDTD